MVKTRGKLHPNAESKDEMEIWGFAQELWQPFQRSELHQAHVTCWKTWRWKLRRPKIVNCGTRLRSADSRDVHDTRVFSRLSCLAQHFNVFNA